MKSTYPVFHTVYPPSYGRKKTCGEVKSLKNEVKFTKIGLFTFMTYPDLTEEGMEKRCGRRNRGNRTKKR